MPNACSQSGCHDDKPLAWVGDAYDRWYGTARKPHYGTALAAGRTGEPGRARRSSCASPRDALSPTLVRATALSLLGGYDGADVDAAFRRALLDDEPLLRRTAASAAPIADPARARRTARAAARRTRTGPCASRPPRSSPGPRRRAPDPTSRRRSPRRLADYVKAMEYSLDFSYGGHNLGLLYEQQNDPARAEEAYRRAIAVDDLWPPPKANLALLLARQGKNDEAERLLREVVAANPDEAAGRLLARAPPRRDGPDRRSGDVPRARRGRDAARTPAPPTTPASRSRGPGATPRPRRCCGGRSRSSRRATTSCSPSPTSCCARGRLGEAGPLADRMAAIDPARPEAGQIRELLDR